MSVLDLLALMMSLLKAQDHSARTSPTIIPILLDDVESEKGIIEAVIRRAEGIFIDAGDRWAGTFGQVDVQLKARVEAGIRIPQAGGEDLSMTVEQPTPDQVRAVFPSIPDPTNPGHRTLLGLVTSLFDRDLRDSAFAVIAYDETTLSYEEQFVAWQFITRHLDNLELGSLQTLAIVVGCSSLDVPRHCQTGLSSRFILLGDRFAERKPWARSKQEIVQLAGSDEPTVLFLAAGFSASSANLPLGDGLRDYAIRRLVGGNASSSRQLAEDFFDFLQTQHRILAIDEGLSVDEFAARLTLERVLLEEQRVHGGRDSPTLQYFASLHDEALRSLGRSVKALAEVCAERVARLVLVTVNFDELIEAAAGGLVRPFVDDIEFSEASDYLESYLADGGAIPLLKLHGTISRPESVVATVEQTERGLSDDRARCLQILRDFGERRTRWIYVGYSMRDYDILREVDGIGYAERLDEYWVSPTVAPTIEAFARQFRAPHWLNVRSLWERMITETADAFMEVMLEETLQRKQSKLQA
jgi:hypothetical protein